MSNGDTVEITTDAPGFPVVIHKSHDHFGGGSFVGGIMVGVVGLLMVQRRRRRIAEQVEPQAAAPYRYDAEVEALRRRTATLERIVTEPAARLDREIDALR